MDVRALIRSPQIVQDNLQELPDGRLITLKGCSIQIPVRFAQRDLAYIGVENHIVGIYAMIVDEKYYAVSTVNAMLNIDPTEINKIKIENDDYYEFVFCAGATVFKATTLVKVDKLTYNIYDEVFSKGGIPWYLGYDELGHIFDTAQYHAGANIGQNQEVTELIVSIVARDPKDKTKYYRTAINSLADLTTNPPVYIPLRSVIYGATNTLNKLGGSYMSTGIVAALNSPSTRTERIENLLIQ